MKGIPSLWVLGGNIDSRKMEKRLVDAAIGGDIASLSRLLQEDPLLLHQTVVSCVSNTPLHLSSMLGHLAFVRELLHLNPELVSELDSLSRSALHLAAAKGHLEIVRELVKVGPEMCMVRNQDGKTPLHVAAIKGKMEVVNELVRVQPESILVLTDRNETVLHLCVKHNRFQVLKLLVDEVINRDLQLLNWKDSEGNTVLHVAVSRKQIEIIKFFAAITELDVNALNVNHFTALDVLMQSPRDLRDMEIESTLQGVGVLCAKDLHIITRERVPSLAKVPYMTKSLVSYQSLDERNSRKPVTKHKHIDWLSKQQSALMVVASLIATMAFQAAITPPRCVWQDDLVADDNGKKGPHTARTSIMKESEYDEFMICNTIAFLASLSIILLLISGLPIRRRRWMWLLMAIMWVAITAQGITYLLSFQCMTQGKSEDIKQMVTQTSVVTWLGLMGVIFLGNVVRMNLWILRKYGLIKEKEKKPLDTTDDNQEDV